jgi:hypothetical protein
VRSRAPAGCLTAAIPLVGSPFEVTTREVDLGACRGSPCRLLFYFGKLRDDRILGYSKRGGPKG